MADLAFQPNHLGISLYFYANCVFCLHCQLKMKAAMKNHNFSFGKLTCTNARGDT